MIAAVERPDRRRGRRSARRRRSTRSTQGMRSRSSVGSHGVDRRDAGEQRIDGTGAARPGVGVVQPAGLGERRPVVRRHAAVDVGHDERGLPQDRRPRGPPRRSRGTAPTAASDRRQSYSRRRSYAGNIEDRCGACRTTTRAAASSIVTTTVSLDHPPPAGRFDAGARCVDGADRARVRSGAPPAARRRSHQRRLRRLPVPAGLAAVPDLDDLAVDHPEDLDAAVLVGAAVVLGARPFQLTVTIVPSSCRTTVSKCSTGHSSSVACSRSIVSCDASATLTSPAL